MKQKLKIIIPTIILIGLVIVLVIVTNNASVAVLEPKGIVAEKQRDLLVVATLLMLIVVIPVFAMTIGIAWRYRENNPHVKYRYQRDSSRIAESIWWGFPLAIIVALSVIIVQSSHELDPYRPLSSSAKPVTIQVVAMQWKWLFIYPEYDIATVNFIQFPEDTPVNFRITSDAPMNSFWIPSLGGQVYAMSGMETKLHLMANEPGDYAGSSANLSGEGFAGMKFVARASSRDDFDDWVDIVKQKNLPLTTDTYTQLIPKSKDVPASYYSTIQKDLYDTIIRKYMEPVTDSSEVKQSGQHE